MILQTLITQYFPGSNGPLTLRPKSFRRLSDTSSPPPKRRRGTRRLDRIEAHARDGGECEESYDGNVDDYDSSDDTAADDEMYGASGEWEDDDTDAETGIDLEATPGETINNGRGNLHFPAPGERVPIHTQRPHPISPLYALVLSNSHRDSTFTTFRNSLELVQIKDIYCGYLIKNCTRTTECEDGGRTPCLRKKSSPSSAGVVKRKDTRQGCGFLFNTKLCNNSEPIPAKCQPQRGDLKDEPHVRIHNTSHQRRLRDALCIRRNLLINDLCTMSVVEKWNRGEYIKRLSHLGPEATRMVRHLEGRFNGKMSPLRNFALPTVGNPITKRAGSMIDG
jgi:hypothetical protein